MCGSELTNVFRCTTRCIQTAGKKKCSYVTQVNFLFVCLFEQLNNVYSTNNTECGNLSFGSCQYMVLLKQISVSVLQCDQSNQNSCHFYAILAQTVRNSSAQMGATPKILHTGHLVKWNMYCKK